MTLRTCVLAGHTLVRPTLSLLTVVGLAAGLVGCADQDLSLAPEVVADPIRISTDEGAAPLDSEDAGVLHFVNAPDTTLDVLDEDVGLDRRAAERIVRHRDGQDGVAGSDDDQLFVSVEELLAVPYVGPAAVEALDAYLAELAMDGAEVEGVAFTDEEANLALALANTATFTELDLDFDLDRRAAEGIVSGRPFGDLDDVAEVRFVGPASLERLRAATAEMDLQ